MKRNLYIGRTICTFLLVLMPLGHALMILMEHFLSPTALHYAVFGMGFIGLCVVIAGVFVQTTTEYINGIGVTHDFYINGQALDTFAKPEIKALRGSRPEYLILLATI